MWSGSDSGRCYHAYNTDAKEFICVKKGSPGGGVLFMCCVGHDGDDDDDDDLFVTYIALATEVKGNLINLCTKTW